MVRPASSASRRSHELFNAALKGTIEADETFVGGKEKNKHADKRTKGTGYVGKTAVLGLRERGGELRTMVVPGVSGAVLKPIVTTHVAPGSTLMTDEFGGYRGLNAVYDHQTVRHGAGEYVRDDVHTNGIESVWALLKRQIIGVHHWVSRKHLDHYVSEMTWRFNRRELKVTIRMNDLFACIEGRLTYKALIA